MFDLIIISLSIKEDPIFEKKGYKRYTFMFFYSSYLKIVFALLKNVIILYIQVSIVEIQVLYFKGSVQSISLFLGL